MAHLKKQTNKQYNDFGLSGMDAYIDDQIVCIDPGHSEDRERPSADSDRHLTDSTQRGRVREHAAVLEQTLSNVGRAEEWGQR